MAWRVQLQGHEYDLRELVAALGKDYWLEELDGRKVLASSQWTNLREAGDVRAAATRAVAVATDALYLFDPGAGPITCGSVYRLDGRGGFSTWVFPDPAVVSVRAFPPTVLINGKPSVGGPKPVRLAASAALADSRLEDALRFYAEGGWGALYKALEIVEDGVSRSTMISRGWATRAELVRFTHTANSLAALGRDARHGSERTTPPANPMSIEQARELVGRILRLYLGGAGPPAEVGAT